MDRYTIQAAANSWGGPYWKEHKDETGPFVLFSDAQSEIARLTAEVERLRCALSEIEKLGHGPGAGYGYTCANIAAQALQHPADRFEADKSAMICDELDEPVPPALIQAMEALGWREPAPSQPTCKSCDDELICPACGKTYFRGLQHAGWRTGTQGDYVVYGCCQDCVDKQ